MAGLKASLQRLFAGRGAGRHDSPVAAGSPPPLFPAREPATGGHRLEAEDGRAVLVEPDGRRRPLVRGRDAFPALREGWSSSGFHLELAPVVIVSLRHRDGGLACWIIDGDGETYFEPVSGLPAAMRDTLRRATLRLLARAHEPGASSLADWPRLQRTVRLELLAESRRDVTSGDNLIDLLAAEQHGSAALLPVQAAGDQFSVLLPGGAEIPLLLGERVLRPSDLQAGWSAVSLYRDFAPLYVLQLRHVSGSTAAWLLDRQLRQLGDIAHTPAELRELLLRQATPVMNHVLDAVLAFRDPDSDPVLQRYLGLAPSVRQFLVTQSGGGAIRPALAPLGPGQMPAALAVGAAPVAGTALALRPEAVAAAVSADLHQRTLGAIRSGWLEWPSPVDASETRLRGIFTFDDYVFVYQFTDRNGLDFLLVAGDRCARVVGLVVPAANLMLFDDRFSGWSGDTWLRNERGNDFWSLLVRHINHYPEEMAARGRTPRARPVNVLLSNLHIGHHLWNDLTGLEALCASAPASRLPQTMILAAADGQAELFGPVDALFPEIAGHVDRSLPDVDAFVRWTYRHDVWPARITRDHVSKALRERVMRELDQNADAEPVRRLLAARPGAGASAPVVVFGMRVEDRTFVDLPGFCEAFVAFMAARHPGAVIVFDGHNRGPGQGAAQIIRGMAYELAREPPEQVEAEIVAALQERFAQAPVTLVGTTGQSIAASLAWCRRADAAFALWGAGLAKYRWLANLPTMMISTRANLLGRPDLAIYTDARFTEAPASFLFADPALVVDAGQEAALAGRHVQGGRECFSADTDQVLLAFDAFLERARNGAAAGATGPAAR